MNKSYQKTILSVAAAIALTTTLSQANENQKYNSFSYIGFGMETTTYQELYTMSDGTKVKSLAKATSPVYTSGSLIYINEKFDFSIDAASTLMATQTDEQWQQNNIIKQNNKFDVMQSDLKFLAQYKYNDNHRIVFGPNYNMIKFKRHTYTNPATGSSVISAELNQEDIATLNATIGYWYESAPFSNGGIRYKGAVLYGKPIWNRATNTGTSEVEFHSKNGSVINLNGYLGYEIMKGLEIGGFMGYTYRKKTGSDTTTTTDGTDIVWPNNNTETIRYGVSFIWNFDVK